MLGILLKRAETSIARIVVFNGFLYHDRATLLPFYTVRSSCRLFRIIGLLVIVDYFVKVSDLMFELIETVHLI
jgi:hypothetical protein